MKLSFCVALLFFLAAAHPPGLLLLGSTLTKPVAFADCIKAIKEHAFVASEYPVIITIENHLKVEVQQQAAQVIFRVLFYRLSIPMERRKGACSFNLSLTRR